MLCGEMAIKLNLPGSLDMPDQVRYMVYRVITAACNSPELGWPVNMKWSLKKKKKQIFMVCGRFLKKVTQVKSLELLFIWTWLELEWKHILTFTYFIKFPISSSAMLIDVWKFHLKENDNIAYSSYFLFLLIELNWWVKYKFLSL